MTFYRPESPARASSGGVIGLTKGAASGYCTFTMRKLLVGIMLGLLAGLSTGCGGYYIMTVPDQLAPENGEMVPVARMQRNDFFVLALPINHAPMRFRINQAPMKSAWSDKIGYAAVHFDLGEPPYDFEPGRHIMRVSMLDLEGEEVHTEVPAYIWPADVPVVAVDMDALPREASVGEEDAAAALGDLAGKANIIYLTRNSRTTQEVAHLRLRRGGFPDGPVLLWQRKRWHIVRDGKFKLPRVVVESRLDSQLPQLARDFPNFAAGVTSSSLAAKAFVDAGLPTIVINNAQLQGSMLTHTDWRGLISALPPRLR
jgi:hypothetical protein